MKIVYYDAKHQNVLNEIPFNQLVNSEKVAISPFEELLVSLLFNWLEQTGCIDGRYKALKLCNDWQYVFVDGERTIEFS